MRQAYVSRARYSVVAMLLHWAIAATLLFEIGLGWRMDAPRGPQSFAVYQLHKSVGITVLILTLLRLAWRLTNPPPAFPATMKRWEKALAHMTHLGFYVLLLGLPLTGWLIVSTARQRIPTLLYGLLPWPHLPGVSALEGAARQQVNAVAEFGHQTLIYGAYALLALHIAGALKHQFVDRGADMARMLPAPPRRLAIATIAVLAALGGAFLIGNRVHLGGETIAAAASPPAAQTQAEVAAVPSALVTSPVNEGAGNTAEPSSTLEEAKAAEPVKWNVRKPASTLAFKTKWSSGAIDGSFGKWDADILFSPDALAGSAVSVTVDMSSAITGVPDTQDALPGSDWFAVATHPTARFTAKNFRHLSGNRYEARGTLNLRGTSRPLTLPFTLKISGKQARMSGTAQIDRTTFGVGQGQFATTEDVAGMVSVIVNLTADTK
jgi:cytochrome b561/polyisoprenoid-binding protein YceI